ncbi:MAG TPA: carboxypeptidase-like regulatory domain-containing protein [Thermoguttaceae bacterium]|nr:carboxypeptidase-like regulatory domain-containing protein [Thermoguttaceae bacterium]
MLGRILAIAALTAVLTLAGFPTADAQDRLDVDTIRVDLRTADPDEIAYITYVVALTDQDRLPVGTLNSAFLWARRKPDFVNHVKFQYFKQATITLAAKIGIRLPQGTPDLAPDVSGRVVVRLLLVDVPVINAAVRIRGTDLTATTDAKGEFRFGNVPLGEYVLDASANILLVPRTGSATVLLPTTPPSTQPAFVQIRLN